MSVPEVLLSGNHAEIDRWRREKALENTQKKRPDLLDPAGPHADRSEETA
jgi:tRNA (guanine37-N1)-methyltransferase